MQGSAAPHLCGGNTGIGRALASHLPEGPGRQGCAREQPSGEGAPRENRGPAPQPERL